MGAPAPEPGKDAQVPYEGWVFVRANAPAPFACETSARDARRPRLRVMALSLVGAAVHFSKRHVDRFERPNRKPAHSLFGCASYLSTPGF
jgi:hypothetical protein